MAMLTIRNLDDTLKAQLRIRAAQHGLSMEEEVRRILQQVLSPQNSQKGFGTRLHQRVMALTGGVDLSLPIRSLPRVAPTLQDWHYNDDRFIPCPHETQADEYHP